MIFIYIQGGIGNQMFQFALASILADKYKCKLYLDTSYYQSNSNKNNIFIRTFELNIFNNNYNIAKKQQIYFLKSNVLINKIKNIFGYRILNRYKETSIKFSNKIFNYKLPLYIEGYFQSYKYLHYNEALINELYQFNTNLLTKEYKDILNSYKFLTTISVHIRRGDYVLIKDINNIHGFIGLDYYEKAIKYFIDSLQFNYQFIFFSDDIEWVKNNFSSINNNMTFVDFNDDKNSWMDMCLMTKCDHNIIANSSFSWWGAWLNKNPSKIVISPLKWYNNDEKNHDSIDLIPKSWIRI
jgi:hypothetical protein